MERVLHLVVATLCLVFVAEVGAHIFYAGRGIDYNTYQWVSGIIAVCVPMVVGYYFKRSKK